MPNQQMAIWLWPSCHVDQSEPWKESYYWFLSVNNKVWPGLLQSQLQHWQQGLSHGNVFVEYSSNVLNLHPGRMFAKSCQWPETQFTMQCILCGVCASHLHHAFNSLVIYLHSICLIFKAITWYICQPTTTSSLPGIDPMALSPASETSRENTTLWDPN